MRQDTFEAIELFVEKAEKLKTVDFVKSPKLAQFHWSWNQGNETVEITGPRSQDIDALILTYRFFFDQKEHCSFRWLAENVLNDSDLSEKWKNGFCELRDSINNYLDSYPSIKVKNDSYPSPMTNLEIKDLFLYGNLSHATWNMENRNKFKQWMSHRATKGLLTSQFVEILFVTLDVIFKVSDLCKSELEKNTSSELCFAELDIPPT
ncbi:MAG: hypothetical protein WBB69_10910 [Anaerolineales bacterium]